MKQTWDIFCTVIDNYGDVGVCWRIARQLTVEHNITVRLWLDDVNALATIWTDVDVSKNTQQIEHIEINHWRAETNWAQVCVADVVVEAFACTIPSAYVEKMLLQKKTVGIAPRWVNLEYLSAEAWIDGCHGLSSPQRNGLSKTFFFPGFTPYSGGLLREQDLLKHRDVQDQSKIWMKLTDFEYDEMALKIVLFGYDHMPLAQWLPLLMTDRPIQLAVTNGKASRAVQAVLDESGITNIEQRNKLLRSLSIKFLPMLRQDCFDELLWAADINFVRGEDSFVRALWAGKPLVWQIYPQDDEVHFDKLNAFIERYSNTYLKRSEDGADHVDAALKAWGGFLRAWNGLPDVNLKTTWLSFIHHIESLRNHAVIYTDNLAQIDDLTQQLVRHLRNPLV